ncbi:MAG: DUF3574 domain-containing protein [Mycobacteriaceae bacterium]|nr:DUF3574 domain-containing protein [Mycobacteriaceae bacterium]
MVGGMGNRSPQVLATGLTCATLGLTAGLGLGAGGSAPGATATDQYHRTELYFGAAKPDGSAVRPEEFQNFVDKEITPAFPAGLTVLTGSGQWQRAPGAVVKEGAFVVILLYPRTAPHADADIENIRSDYKRFFAQESVLRVDSVQRVSF